MRKTHSELDTTLNKLLQTTLEQTLKGCASSVPWAISKVETLEELAHPQCIIVTISSFKFRIMCLLHVSLDADIRQFVAEATATRLDAQQESDLIDYLLEMSNSFCGTLKRHLQGNCPPLGMSTPNLLDRTSLKFDETVGLSLRAHARAQMEAQGPALFAASILVSVRQEGDFNLPSYQEYFRELNSQTESCGELELF